MTKFIASSMKLWLALCFIFCQTQAFAQVNASTPEATARAFYSWYIPRLAKDGNYPLMDKEIYHYVNKGTVDLLRFDYKKNKFADRAEYFTKSQDFDEKDWLANMTLHPAITLDDVVIVPVTFGSKEKNTVVVFLRKIDGVWKITKVDDLVDYS
ncbi:MULTISPECIES: DUF3828 domain-containing protein [Paraburkholderia]|uniref:DUF3828 domain-containing protein n=1 Tax=Paraburkholderia TaxID=1822464 RepID=UPI00225AF347|nr:MULTISPECIES: DUF3828 domain-containing protein [Paraburkholderia]MCX4165328.1 DUF3828 domain-containing protein [Paraburkholderia megapolitana]MDN7160820.1 YbjP/YqhG family protein [Paraburkholderia sp. CHISQ3]MDQ6497867.1 YbjP/YqhG family protein [Paraburkholderia megapolitana]